MCYFQLSERQKLFAQKSPLNCSQVMYGGSSARSSLSKILGNTPPIHRKAVIPISSTNNSEIRTTSSILLEHISTKVSQINNLRKCRKSTESLYYLYFHQVLYFLFMYTA